MKRINLSIVLFALALSGCNVPNPVDYVKNKVNAPPTAEEKAAVKPDESLPKPDVPVPANCSKDAALVLCFTYESIDALTADPNIKKFGFQVTVDTDEVHHGIQPGLKYRTLKDGSVTRG